MKKELKQFIKEHKLSDDDILKLINIKPSAPAESEQDVKDEADEESETQSDSKETEEADSGIAPESHDKPKEDVESLVKRLVAEALKPKGMPAAKPTPKPNPAPAKLSVNKFTLRTE